MVAANAAHLVSLLKASQYTASEDRAEQCCCISGPNPIFQPGSLYKNADVQQSVRSPFPITYPTGSFGRMVSLSNRLLIVLSVIRSAQRQLRALILAIELVI